MTEPVDLHKMPIEELRAHAESVGAQLARSREQLIKNIEAVTEMPPPMPVHQTDMVWVRVADSCPHNMIQSAGAMWSRRAVAIRADDTRLPELRGCELLTVTTEAP